MRDLHTIYLNPAPGQTSGETSPPIAGDDVMKILSDVEGQLNRLRSAQKVQDDSLMTLSARSKALREAEEALTNSQQELAAREQSLQREREQLMSQRQQFEQAQHSTEQHRQQMEAQFARRQSEIDARSAETARQQTEFERERERLAAVEEHCRQVEAECSVKAKQLDSERSELTRRIEQAEKNVGDLIKELERSQQQAAEQSKRAEKFEKEAGKTSAKLEAAEAENSTLEKKLQQAQAVLKEREAQSADSQKKLELAGKKLSEFAQILSEQTPQLEKGASALAMVEQQNEQIERLTKQIAELQLKSDPEEMQRKEQRINELTEALRQSRGQNAGGAGVAEIELRNAQLSAEVDRLRLEAQNAQLAADQARQQLQQHLDNAASQTVQDAALGEHAAKVSALTAEIEQLHKKAADDIKSQLEAQAQRHKKELADSGKSESKAVKDLKARVTQLEQELDEARQTSDSAPSGEVDHTEYAEQLRAKAEKVSVVAEHLRRRRARLNKLKTILIHRAANASPSPTAEMRTEEVEKILQEKQQLAEVRRMLAASEQRMIRRWARPKAVFTVVSMFVLAAICAAASWLTIDHLFPATVSASVVFEARAEGNTKLLAEQADNWSTWHGERLSDSAFQETLAKRMGERRLDMFNTPALVAHRMQRDVTIDTEQPGVVIVTMTGENPQEMTAFLDVAAATLMAESSRQAHTRGDNAKIIVSGERREEGRAHYASVNAVPVRDERMTYAVPAFGGLFGFSLILMVGVYVKLARSKRVFDQDDTLYLDARSA